MVSGVLLQAFAVARVAQFVSLAYRRSRGLLWMDGRGVLPAPSLASCDMVPAGLAPSPPQAVLHAAARAVPSEIGMESHGSIELQWLRVTSRLNLGLNVPCESLCHWPQPCPQAHFLPVLTRPLQTPHSRPLPAVHKHTRAVCFGAFARPF